MTTAKTISSAGVILACLVWLASTGFSQGIKPMTAADLERLYLDGKISAKQYQRLLNEVQSRPPAASAPSKAQPPVVSTASGTNAVPPAAILNKDDKINEVENKMDELIRARAAREKATNVTARPVTAGPKTKRERLNDLLRLYIEGKISQTELDERRGKILAEPD